MKEWEKFFPEEERKIYEKAGYIGKQPFGRNPALLIIDVILGFTGTSTCGCVHGTVLDGYSYGFPVFVVEDCVFDRSRTSHLVNLFEMNSKYATVIPLAEALNHVNGLKRLEGRQAIAR